MSSLVELPGDQRKLGNLFLKRPGETLVGHQEAEHAHAQDGQYHREEQHHQRDEHAFETWVVQHMRQSQKRCRGPYGRKTGAWNGVLRRDGPNVDV